MTRSLLLLFCAAAATALAQDLPKKAPADETPVDAELFANPPILLTEPEAPPKKPGVTRIQAVPDAPKPTVIERQQANVEKLRAQVAALRTRAAADANAKPLLAEAESALKTAETLASEAENLRRKIDVQTGPSAISRLVTPPPKPTRAVAIKP